MKISYNWLKDFIDLASSPEELSEVLTGIGLEVEGIDVYEKIKGGLKGIVVGEVLSCQKHPNADKLSVTTVNTGAETILKIVCGAPNVAAGQKVLVAAPGTELSMGDKSFTIQKTKIRGEDSEGMICAEDEIGLGTKHEGIMVLDNDAVPGTPAAEYFGIFSDSVFEIGLTPNRIDAASHYGVARDLAASMAGRKPVALKKIDVSKFKTDNHDLTVKVSIEDPKGCRRFTGVTITGLNIGPSPEWLQQRLKAIGLSPINNVVDVTNYVLHELGQPLHAYDADKLYNKEIIVKRLKEGTPFITLDGLERKLSDQDVMVCDGKNPACIGGVFGGFESGVTESTKSIFLESAYFDPVSVRKTARRYGLNTDASFRFERGVDPQNTLVAMKRAAILIKEIAGGQISSEVVDIHPSPINPVIVPVLYSHIDRLIGKQIDHQLIKQILHALEIEIIKEDGDQLSVKVPPYRVDVTREADVIEDILRIYGYNNIEFSEKLNASVSYVSKPDNEQMVNKVSDYLTSNGFTEIMSNSLTKNDHYTGLISFTPERLVPIMNPLSADLSVMRQTLLFGGLEAISRNINFKHPDLRLYEYGRIYALKDQDTSRFENFSEEPVFALFLSGNTLEQSWAVEESPVNFFHLKAYFSAILDLLGIDKSMFSANSLESHKDIFSGGIEYNYRSDNIIRAGLVNKRLCQQFDIDSEVYFGELRWEKILALAALKKRFSELPKFPEVRRDLALLIDENTTFGEIEKLAYQAEKSLLKKVNLFDYYRGKNIPEGKKSYAVSFFLQDLTKTLTDKEIDRIMGKIVDSLKKTLRAELR
jgi:phenylalanyl-tRNA synthetase beta chain